MDRAILSLLVCPACLPGTTSPLRQKNASLECETCATVYPVDNLGIAHFTAPQYSCGRFAEHEQHWDEVPEPDYERVCIGNRNLLEAIDRIHLKYCHGNFLEVGCGSGRFLEKVKPHGSVNRIIGLDISAGMLSRARRKGLEYLVHSPAERLPFRDAQCQTVASTFSSLKYVDRAHAFKEIHRILAPGGILTFDLINYWPYLIDHVWWEYLRRGRLPPSDVSNTYILSTNMRNAGDELRRLTEAGFKLTEMKSVWYVPFLRGRLRRLSYWPGRWGSRIGYNTIFVARRI